MGLWVHLRGLWAPPAAERQEEPFPPLRAPALQKRKPVFSALVAPGMTEWDKMESRN